MGNCRMLCERLQNRKKISRMFLELVGIGYKACRPCNVMIQTEDRYCPCCGYQLSIIPTRSGKKSSYIKMQQELVKRY